jgi:hypothetical protein
MSERERLRNAVIEAARREVAANFADGDVTRAVEALDSHKDEPSPAIGPYTLHTGLPYPWFVSFVVALCWLLVLVAIFLWCRR